MKNQIKKERWTLLIFFSLLTEILYYMVYVKGYFYIPFQEAFRLTNTQMGVTSSVYGAAAILLYFPGGWLADRVSFRKLIAISLIMTGLGGLYLITYPSYLMLIVLHIYWGVTSILTFWAALIKAIRMLGSSEDQGKAFGVFEGSRGIITLLIPPLMVGIFAYLGSGKGGLTAVILFTSIACIVTGIIAGLVLKNTKETEENKDTNNYGNRPKSLDLIKQALRMPDTWLLALIILGSYTAYCGQMYINPMATQVYGASVTFAAFISTMLFWARPVTAAVSGVLADKIGSARIIIFGFIILIITYLVLILVPGSSALISMFIVDIIVMSAATYITRAVYFALLEERKIDMALTGMIVGIASTIGFSCDLWLPLMGGYFLDKYPAVQAYKYIFSVYAITAAIGLIATIVMKQRIAKKKAEMSQTKS